jgi:hypothetical protein
VLQVLHQEEMNPVLESAEAFRTFLQREEEVLRAAGFANQLAEDVRTGAEAIRETLRQQVPLHPDELFDRIRQVREGTCGLAWQRQGELDEAEQAAVRERSARQARRVVLGGAIVFVNASAFFASLGAGAAFSALSGAVGSGFMFYGGPIPLRFGLSL